jgi:uncharacterized protein YggT (Ycf19 family)
MTNLYTVILQFGVTLARFTLGFYSFWFIWRVLLPILPGPVKREERIAPFALYFSDPFVKPLSRLVGEWFAAVIGLLIIALLDVGVAYLATLV